jgi:hypothetical protein
VFNGHQGVVISDLNQETGRYAVKIQEDKNKQLISLKSQNIVKITDDDMNILKKAHIFYDENINMVLDQIQTDKLIEIARAPKKQLKKHIKSISASGITEYNITQ